MSLAILIALVAAGVVLWPLNTSVSIEAPIKKLLNFAALLTLGLTQGALGASGTLFTDSFPGSGVAPFAVESGKWTVANGVLSGTSPVNGYGYAYYSASGWGNYTVQANICFSITNGSWGGGLGGQLNATTGAHYGAWVYPEGSGGGSAMLKLIKFQGWTSWSGTPMASANLTKGVGTNWHTVAVTFQGANITVSYDGTQVISVTDNNFGGVAPFTTGGISVDMATDPTAYTLGVSNVVVTAVSTPPVANNDSYSALQGTTLMVAAPGVLANDTGGSGPLTAQWVSGTASGSLTLNTNGSFTYTPNTGFAGTDSFTYAATDGVNISPPATVTITVTSSSGVLLSDTFPGTSLSPFVQESGTWTVANHVLSGTCAVNTYGHLYVTTNWTNYSVQAQVQFPSGAFGGGIGGRLNASNGAHYGVWVYPEGSAGGSAVMKLMKFTGWTTWSGTPMATASLTTGVGTAWHTLLVTFQGSTITAFFDGTQEISVTDNSFGSVAPYADGGITVDMSAYPSTYTMSASNVVVNATGSTAPGIVTQPVSQGVAAGANVSFSVTASGTPPLSYQWQFNGANLSGATTSSLTLTNVQTANAGSYTVVVTNSAGSVSSAAAVLTVLTAPAIVTEPVGQSVLAGANVNFNVTASGTPPLGYQWQFNGANLSGATASSLTLTSVQTANAGSYTVEVTNSAGSVSSAAAVLTVLTAPAVVSQPVSQTVGAGANVSFSVAASGTPPLSYQWQFNGANLSGATGSSLTLTSVQTANAGSYTVEVTNSAGSVSSAAAVLTVLTAPAIVSQPVSQTVAAGANVSFSVTASGAAPLSYQWQFNGANLSGATTGSLTLTSVQTADAGSYTVVVSNSFGSVTSAAAVLTLLIPPAIVTQPASQSVTAGANVGFSVTASGTAPLSYQWQFNGANLSGATGSNFTLTSVQTPNAGNYVVVVTNLAGSVTSAAALLTVLTPPAIVTQPVSQSVATDANVGFSVTASGTPPLSYQWQFNGAALSGATTNSLTLTSVQTASAGSYAVVVTNSAGSVTSAAAVLTVVTAPAIVTQPASQSVAAGANVGFSVTTSGTAPLSYQWQFNGAALSAATTSSLALTGVQTPNAGNYTVVVTNLAGSVTSAAAVLTVLTPPAIVTQPVSQTVAAGSNVTFSVAASGTPPLSYQWLFNGAALSAATSSSLALSGVQTANAGSYNVVVTNSFGSLTSAAAALTVLIAPAIITQPASQTVVAGSNVSFSVTAFGTAPLRYQWRFNGTALSAATSSSLALTAVRTANAGSYTVFVTNSAASVTSAAAVLTVLPAPAITINGGLTYQVIDGFGVNANHRSWNNNELQPVLDALINQGGMTLFHVIFDNNNWEAVNDNSNPDVMNWSYYDTVYSSTDFQKLWGIMGYLNQQGITTGLVPDFEGPVALWMGGLSLTPGYEDEYAETIASLLVYARNTEGLQFSVVGPANEEDITYTGINMTGPAQYVTVMHDLSTQLNNNGMSDVRFSGPDLANTSTSWLGQMMTDPVVMGKLAHFGLHSYQNMSLDSSGVYNYIKQSAYPNTHFWMTEYNVWCASCQDSGGGNNSWAFAQGTAAWLLHHLGNGASAGIVWEGYDSVYYPYNASTGGNNPGQWSFWGLFAVNDTNATVKTYTPRKGFYTLAQIANYVRPGAQRIGVSGSVPSLLTLLAFYNASNEQITLTGVNSNSTASTIVCGLASLPAIPSLYLYYTSSTTNLAYGGSVPVTAGEFSAVVPANCVYTLTYTNTGAAVVMGAGQPAAARPYFLAPFVRNGQVFLTVVGERGRACLIETSSDLETWSELQTVTLLDGTATISQPVATSLEAEALVQEKGLTPADGLTVTNEPRTAVPHFYRATLLP